MLYIYVLEIY